MATYNSTQYAKIVNVERDGVQLETNEISGDVLCSRFSITQSAVFIGDDALYLTVLPRGATIIQAYLTRVNPNSLACLYMLGTDNQAEVFSATPVNGSAPAQGIYLDSYTTSEEEILIATLSAVTDGGTIGEKLRGYVLYFV